VLNLRCDATLWRWSTWQSAATYLFGRRGLVRQTFKPWREYFRRDFHPSQQDATASRRWLQAHRGQYVPVGIAT
jgi:predicted metal-dependent hydrolase